MVSDNEANDDRSVLLRVSASSDAAKLASAISHAIYDGKQVSLRAIGAGAVNQTAKGMAIAQSYVGSRGFSLSTRIGFTTVEMTDGKVSALVFKVLVD